MLQEEVARMFGIMQVVGVVHDALDVAFVVAHLHDGLVVLQFRKLHEKLY